MLTLAGAILIYQSVKASPSEASAHSEEIVYIGPIPIVIAGSRRWIVLAIAATCMILVWLFADMIYPGSLGLV